MLTRALIHMWRETFRPENNGRMFMATILFIVFCILMSFRQVL